MEGKMNLTGDFGSKVHIESGSSQTGEMGSFYGGGNTCCTIASGAKGMTVF